VWLFSKSFFHIYSSFSLFFFTNMVSFVESRGVKAFFTVLVVVQVLILCIRYDGDRFSFLRCNKATHPVNVDENKVEYKYVVATSSTIEASNKEEFQQGGVRMQRNAVRGLEDRRRDIKIRRILLPAKSTKESKAPTNGPTSTPTTAPTNASTNAPTQSPTKGSTKAFKKTKAPKSTTSTPTIAPSNGKRKQWKFPLNISLPSNPQQSS
jgi:hypothetical protein